MPRAYRRSRNSKKLDRVFRIYDEFTQKYYGYKPGAWRSKRWTENVAEARIYKRISDAMNSISQNGRDFEISEGRYKIVEYKLVEEGIVDSLDLVETWREKKERERREQEGTGQVSSGSVWARW